MYIHDERFLTAIEELLQNEGPKGEIANDPDDPGKLTRWGISQRSYPEFWKTPQGPTKEQAMEVYYRDWWVKRRIREINDLALATELLDLMVPNPTKIAMAMQRAVPKTGGQWLDVDGFLGDVSIEAINSHPNPAWLLDRFRLEAIAFFHGLNKTKFLASWVRRALN